MLSTAFIAAHTATAMNFPMALSYSQMLLVHIG